MYRSNVSPYIPPPTHKSGIFCSIARFGIEHYSTKPDEKQCRLEMSDCESSSRWVQGGVVLPRKTLLLTTNIQVILLYASLTHGHGQ